MWLDAGIELGNHTFSHRSLNAIPLEEYEDDFSKARRSQRNCLRQRERRSDIFAIRFLHTGRTMEIKAEFDDFLKQHGYTIAPITFDNGDYIFRGVRQRFRQRRHEVDEKSRRSLRAVYGGETRVLGTAIRQSCSGGKLSQTLLIHANFINSDHLGDLAAMFKRAATILSRLTRH